jgi:hypothetical protein
MRSFCLGLIYKKASKLRNKIRAIIGKGVFWLIFSLLYKGSFPY